MFRAIPLLLIDKNEACINTRKFYERQYLGDPVNITRIFSEKAADELIILDIDKRENVNVNLISEIATECFMPLTFGGNIKSLQECRKIISLGVEKLAISERSADFKLISSAALEYGSQALVGILNYCDEIDAQVDNGISINTNVQNLIERAQKMEEAGFGEILLHNNSRDGMKNGYDLESIREVAQAVSIPIIALGGAKNYADLITVKNAGAAAAAASTIFVNYGSLNAVLITYSNPAESGLF